MLKRKILRWLVVVMALPLMFTGTVVMAEATKVTIVHFNDMDRMGAKGGRGGVAKLATIISEQRMANENVLVTFGGDTISPSLMSGLDQGAHMIELLNQLDLTAMVLGNHEFDFGPEIAKVRISEANFPVLGTNTVDPEGNIIDGALDSIMVEAGDFKIGIFGLTTVGTLEKSSPGEYTFLDPLAVAEEQAGILREAGADLVIALTHTDTVEDKVILESEVVDLLLSGDDHTQIVDFSNDTLFVESGGQAERVTVIDVYLDREEDDDGMKTVWNADYRILDSIRYEGDPEVASVVAVYEGQLDEQLNVELGVTETPLDTRRETIRGKEAAFGNMVADAIREATGADISFANGGGIRGDRTYDAGSVLTRRDIQSELPFGNKTVVMEVSGQVIIDALENGFSRIEDGSGRFPQISGINVVVNPNAEPGSRVVEVTQNGAPLDPEGTFVFAVNNYLAGGGDGYGMFADQKRIVNEYAGVLDAVQVFNYISSRGTVAPEVEGRIVYQE